MQQGDCNTPSTFQQLMTIIFWDYIGRFVPVYLDDIFVYSNLIEEHEKHLKLVFDKLRQVHLYLEESKLDLYSKRMDCLGHLIDDHGIHADSDKMLHICGWGTPRNNHDVQRFLGLSAIFGTFYARCICVYQPSSHYTKERSPVLMETHASSMHE